MYQLVTNCYLKIISISHWLLVLPPVFFVSLTLILTIIIIKRTTKKLFQLINTTINTTLNNHTIISTPPLHTLIKYTVHYIFNTHKEIPTYFYILSTKINTKVLPATILPLASMPYVASPNECVKSPLTKKLALKLYIKSLNDLLNLIRHCCSDCFTFYLNSI